MRSLLLLLIPAIAFAGPKYTRNQDLHIDVKTSQRTKPLPTAADSHVPTASADDVLRIELSKGPIHAEQESILMQLIIDSPDDDADKPDYMFRLAEMYAREMQLWKLRSAQIQLTKE